MGTISHRLGQIIGGGIVAGAGYGLTFLNTAAQTYFQFMESLPINIPTLLTYSSWALYGLGGLMAGWGVIGLLYTGIHHLLTGSEDKQPGHERPQQQPRSRQGKQQQATDQSRRRQQGQKRQPPRDQRDEPQR